MRQKGYYIGIGAALGMFLLIIDSKTALQGAAIGIELCLKTVIPSLFPFFVLSSMLTSSLLGTKAKLLGPIGRLCGIPVGAESIFLTGLIGGYPLGARNIGISCASGQLSKEDGKRMMAFCSNAGPAFIFGMAGAMFDDPWIPWALWGIHIMGAVLTAMILPRYRCVSSSVNRVPPISLPAAVRSSIGAMANVCAWVVLFRILIAFLERWALWLLPGFGQVLIAGLLELSNGCCALDRVANTGMRFILCSAILAFGGLCVAMQTVSAAPQVDRKLYLPGKILQTAICVFLSCIIQWAVPSLEKAEYSLDILIVSLFFTLLGIGLLRKMQKRSSIPKAVGV